MATITQNRNFAEDDLIPMTDFSVLPDGYVSYFTHEQKISAVLFSCRKAREIVKDDVCDHTIILAGLYGSTCSGTDRIGSDFDVMVVMDGIRKTYRKEYDAGDDPCIKNTVDMKIIPAKEFLKNVMDTVHGICLSNSPFTVVHPGWKPYFSSYRWNPYQVRKTSQSAAVSTLYSGSEDSKSLGKRFLQAYQFYVFSLGKIFVSREDMNSGKEHFFQWLEESTHIRIEEGRSNKSQTRSLGKAKEDKTWRNLDRLKESYLR